MNGRCSISGEKFTVMESRYERGDAACPECGESYLAKRFGSDEGGASYGEEGELAPENPVEASTEPNNAGLWKSDGKLFYRDKGGFTYRITGVATEAGLKFLKTENGDLVPAAVGEVDRAEEMLEID